MFLNCATLDFNSILKQIVYIEKILPHLRILQETRECDTKITREPAAKVLGLGFDPSLCLLKN
jgi:hypothetical protein